MRPPGVVVGDPCPDQMPGMGEMGEGYAQSNKKMREMEKEAYLEGNMMFRDWTDTRKKDTLTESLSTRSIQVSERNHKIYFKLLERWNKK